MMTEGIEHRLLAKIRDHHSYSAFIGSVKTKRYTWTRLNRLMIYILLNITTSRMDGYAMKDAVRVLAMNRTGQSFLKTLPEDLLSSPMSTVRTGIMSRMKSWQRTSTTSSAVHSVMTIIRLSS